MISRIFTAVILFLTLCRGAVFPMSGFTFSGGVSTDYYSGEIREIVYPSSGWTNDYLSELIWEIDNIVMLTGHFTAEHRNLSMVISAGTAVNKGTGEMDDYDWGDSSSSDWTNWSNSNIFLDKSLVLDTSITYLIKPNLNISLPLGVGYRLNYFKWSDALGKLVYLWDLSSNPYVPLSTPYIRDYDYKISAINYTFTQNIFFITTGIHFSVGALSGAIMFSYSPFIKIWDLDHHILTKTFFLDTFTAQYWYKYGINIYYKNTANSYLFYSFNFEELPETKGDSDYYGEDPSDSDKLGSYLGTVPSSAGFASKILSVSIGYIHRF